MLNLEEIQSLYPNINKDIVSEGVKQAEERLKDSLVTKAQLEQKAFVLLGSYTTIQLALFSAIAFLYKTSTLDGLFFALLILGFVFTCGSVFLVFSLKASDYGTLGRIPDTWLQSGTLDGDDSTHALMLAYVLYGYNKRIQTSIDSNYIKCRMLNIAILLGASSPLLFITIWPLT